MLIDRTCMNHIKRTVWVVLTSHRSPDGRCLALQLAPCNITVNRQSRHVFLLIDWSSFMVCFISHHNSIFILRSLLDSPRAFDINLSWISEFRYHLIMHIFSHRWSKLRHKRILVLFQTTTDSEVLVLIFDNSWWTLKESDWRLFVDYFNITFGNILILCVIWYRVCSLI